MYSNWTTAINNTLSVFDSMSLLAITFFDNLNDRKDF